MVPGTCFLQESWTRDQGDVYPGGLRGGKAFVTCPVSLCTLLCPAAACATMLAPAQLTLQLSYALSTRMCLYVTGGIEANRSIPPKNNSMENPHQAPREVSMHRKTRVGPQTAGPEGPTRLRRKQGLHPGSGELHPCEVAGAQNL